MTSSTVEELKQSLAVWDGYDLDIPFEKLLQQANGMADAIRAFLGRPHQIEAQGSEPVAWRVKDFADGWIIYHSEEEARRTAKHYGGIFQPLYALTRPDPSLGSEPVAWRIRRRSDGGWTLTADGQFAKLCVELDGDEVQPLYSAPPSLGSEPEVGLPMNLAPRDGTIVRLLVDYRGQANWTPLEDAEEAWTIGSNNFDNDEEDLWRFAGWNWQQDYWCEGFGKPVAWAPFDRPAKPSPPSLGMEGVREAVDAFCRKYVQIQWAIPRDAMKPGVPGCHAVPVEEIHALAALLASISTPSGEAKS